LTDQRITLLRPVSPIAHFVPPDAGLQERPLSLTKRKSVFYEIQTQDLSAVRALTDSAIHYALHLGMCYRLHIMKLGLLYIYLFIIGSWLL
jgi:hypothetical protein